MSAAMQASRAQGQSFGIMLRQYVDINLLLAVCVLVGLGLVMVASSSIGIADKLTGDPFYYFNRQVVFTVAGVVCALMVYRIRLTHWENSSLGLLLFVLFLLTLVLIPGIGKTVNGSSRWLAIGPFSLQASEFAKLFMIIYLAGYMVRHGKAVRETFGGFLRPIVVLGIVCTLLLLEPDFGASVVLMATALGMLFLGGVRLFQFAGLLMLSLGAMAILAISSPYRMERLTAFLNPWADPFDSGFQLTQSLIAIGSGSWSGVGLGGSVQKLFYLPEAHTDFLFAVMAEELGLIGIVVVIGLYSIFFWRCFMIGRDAELKGLRFPAYLAYGIGIWLGLQAFINMGVNMGLLPTKGLTLPFMSSGGSSMLVACVAVGLLMRVYREVNETEMTSTRRGSTRRKARA